jgi:hypothetical protein
LRKVWLLWGSLTQRYNASNIKALQNHHQQQTVQGADKLRGQRTDPTACSSDTKFTFWVQAAAVARTAAGNSLSTAAMGSG